MTVKPQVRLHSRTRYLTEGWSCEERLNHFISAFSGNRGSGSQVTGWEDQGILRWGDLINSPPRRRIPSRAPWKTAAACCVNTYRNRKSLVKSSGHYWVLSSMERHIGQIGFSNTCTCCCWLSRLPLIILFWETCIWLLQVFLPCVWGSGAVASSSIALLRASLQNYSHSLTSRVQNRTKYSRGWLV